MKKHLRKQVLFSVCQSASFLLCLYWRDELCCQTDLKKRCRPFWGRSTRPSSGHSTDRAASVCAEIRASRWIRKRWTSAFLPSPGSRLAIPTTRAAVLGWIRATRQAASTCKSPAPWRRWRCLIHSPASGFWISALHRAASPRKLPGGLWDPASWSATRSIPNGQRSSRPISSASALKTPWF